MKIGIFDGLTGKQIERDATAEEVALRESEISNYLELKEIEKNKEQQARELKIAAYEKLGLSPQEIAVLVPEPKPIIPRI